MTAAKANLEWPRVWCEPNERAERKLLVSVFVIWHPFLPPLSIVFLILPAYRFGQRGGCAIVAATPSPEDKLPCP